ncbi:MAG TPA: CBS domain-containing protein [Acetobacteraceae bacterium]|nr:CBS domain-containing protein [Acetobacteraceae bacterium]
MTVAAILKHKGNEIADILLTATVAEAAQVLTARRIGAVLVRDAAGQLLGILSERDIVRTIAREGERAIAMTAAQLMTTVLHTVTPVTTVAEAMTLMTASRVRHLPVLERGQLVGIISIGDVVKARLSQQEVEVDNLKAYVSSAV